MNKPETFAQLAPRSAEIERRFADLHPPLDKQAAVREADRCLYCFDAPCMIACPTHIDVPKFIKKIANDNLEGAARAILDANILGASCARACPVEVLCEGACVMHHFNKQPIEIGRLQRHAMDAFHDTGAPLPFMPGVETGKRVALIGGGPASLACAAELRRNGVGAEIFDARPLPGGLNTYGVAEYKLSTEVSLREIDMIAQLGVVFHRGVTVDAAMLVEIETEFDAVFLGLGMGGIHKLGIAGVSLGGVTNALDFIASYKSGVRTFVEGRVAVIGGGNTAMDAAIAAARLGASEVILVYRRGLEEMPAFRFELERAQREGVKVLWHAQPVAIRGTSHVEALEVNREEVNTESTEGPQSKANTVLAVDTIVIAIGQSTDLNLLQQFPRVTLDNGRVMIDRSSGQTSYLKYFAGGDCTNGGREVVDAVADGKRAAVGIASWFMSQSVSESVAEEHLANA